MSVCIPQVVGRDAELEVARERAARPSELKALYPMIALNPVLWRMKLFAARVLGSLGRFLITSGWPRVALVVALAGALVIGLDSEVLTAAVCGLAIVGAAIVARGARTRIVVQEVHDYGRTDPDSKKPAIAPGAATLLVDELKRLCDHYRGIDESRPDDMDVDRSKPLEATVSLDAFDETLRGAVSKESSVTIGGFAIPFGLILLLVGRLFRGPTLALAFHEHEGRRLLTAQLNMPGEPIRRWRVDERCDEPEDEDGDASKLSTEQRLVYETAHRIFVELSLGGSVEFHAMQLFVEGLHAYRSSLGSSKDRKLRLKEAEDKLMRALSEDEDYALVTYNLGVVYTALAASSRDSPYPGAARAAFAESVARNPHHWRSYYALAASHDPSHDEVIELCRRIEDLDPGRSGLARTNDLMCLAHGVCGRFDEARRHGRKACRLALAALACARLRVRTPGGGESPHIPVLAHQAAVSLLRLAVLYGHQAKSGRGWERALAADRSEKLFKLALATARGCAAPASELEYVLRFNHGHAALDRGRYRMAIEEFLAASRIKPEDAQSIAHLARTYSKRNAPGDRAVAEGYAKHASDLLRSCDAIENPDESAEHDPFRSHDPYNTLARTYTSLDDEAGARTIERRRELALTLRKERSQVRSAAGQATTLDDHATVFVEFEKRIETMLVEQTRAPGEQDDWQIGYLHESLGWSQASRVMKLVGTRTCALDAAEHLEQAADRLPKAAAMECRVDAIRAVMLARCRRTRATALRAAELAVGADPVNAFARIALGYVLEALADYERASAAWRQALLLDPDDFEIHLRLARCHVGLADDAPTVTKRVHALKTAHRCATDALTMLEHGHPTWIMRARYVLGRVCLDLDDPAAAIGHLRHVESHVDAAPLAGVLIGDAQRLRGRYDLAERCYTTAVKRGAGVRDKLADRAPRSSWSSTITYLTEDARLLSEVVARARLGVARSIAERGGDAARAQRALDEAATDVDLATSELVAAAAHGPSDGFERQRRALESEQAYCAGLIALGQARRGGASSELDLAIDRFSTASELRADSAIYLQLVCALQAKAGLVDADEARSVMERAVACCELARSAALTESGLRDVDELHARLLAARS